MKSIKSSANKKVLFSKKPNRELVEPNSVEIHDWVENRVPLDAKKKPHLKLKRFTFDLPENLHKRIKMSCAAEEITMGDKLNEILRREFPDGT